MKLILLPILALGISLNAYADPETQDRKQTDGL